MAYFHSRGQMLCETLDAASLTPRELAIYVTGMNAHALLCGAVYHSPHENADKLADRLFRGENINEDELRWLRDRVSHHLDLLRKQSARDRQRTGSSS